MPPPSPPSSRAIKRQRTRSHWSSSILQSGSDVLVFLGGPTRAAASSWLASLSTAEATDGVGRVSKDGPQSTVPIRSTTTVLVDHLPQLQSPTTTTASPAPSISTSLDSADGAQTPSFADRVPGSYSFEHSTTRASLSMGVLAVGDGRGRPPPSTSVTTGFEVNNDDDRSRNTSRTSSLPGPLHPEEAPLRSEGSISLGPVPCPFNDRPLVHSAATPRHPASAAAGRSADLPPALLVQAKPTTLEWLLTPVSDDEDRTGDGDGDIAGEADLGDDDEDPTREEEDRSDEVGLSIGPDPSHDASFDISVDRSDDVTRSNRISQSGCPANDTINCSIALDSFISPHASADTRGSEEDESGDGSSFLPTQIGGSIPIIGQSTGCSPELSPDAPRHPYIPPSALNYLPLPSLLSHLDPHGPHTLSFLAVVLSLSLSSFPSKLDSSRMLDRGEIHLWDGRSEAILTLWDAQARAWCEGGGRSAALRKRDVVLFDHIQLDLRPPRARQKPTALISPIALRPTSSSRHTVFYRLSSPLPHETAADLAQLCVDLRWARSDAGVGRVAALVDWVESGGMGE